MPRFRTTAPFSARTVSRTWKRRAARTRRAQAAQPHPRHIELRLHKTGYQHHPDTPVPVTVTLLRPEPNNPGADHLYIDHLPVPRELWRYDEADRVLHWRSAFGGGQLHFTHDGLGATGNVGPAHAPAAVMAGVTANFTCDVALGAGVTWLSSGQQVSGFVWDTSSTAWRQAAWQAGRLQLSYSVIPGGPMQPPSFSFEFADNATQGLPWDPMPGAFEAGLSAGSRAGQTVWNLGFKSSGAPDPDPGPVPAGGPDTVFPYWLQAVEDAAAATLDGAMEVDGTAPQGTLVGLRGKRANPAVAGYYRTSPAHAPFAVFGAALHVGDAKVPGSRLQGHELVWSGLSAELQQRTGLPDSGSLLFARDGSWARAQRPATDRASAPGRALSATRLSPSAAQAALGAHADLHPQLQQRAGALQAAVATGALDIYGLTGLQQFVQDSQGGWSDVVQTAVTRDLSAIMNSFVPSTLWSLLFPDTPQTALSGELAQVSQSAVAGVSDPSSWYSDLSTAVLANGLAQGSDPYCAQLNGPRAGQWLQSQVSASPVYYAHSQLLFQYEWSQRFPTFAGYLSDQQDNAATYAPQIDALVQSWVADIQANVATDAGSDPNLKQNLVAQMTAAGQYAKDNQLYWAIYFYNWNTSSTVLANIAYQMMVGPASADGSALSRMFQQNASTLTALDPSGFFSKQYIQTVNAFLTTNILPTMFGFNGDAMNFDVVKQYLQTWVANNLTNTDSAIAAQAAQIQQVLSDADADAMLQSSIDVLRGLAEAIDDTLALPYIAQKFVGWFETTYPRFASASGVFGGLMVGGLAALGIFNLVSAFKSWDKLTADQKTDVVLEATQLGLQLVATIVQRGVRAWAMFGVGNLTAGQRAAAIARIVATGEADSLDARLAHIGNTTARWLADTDGSLAGPQEEDPEGIELEDLAAAAQDVPEAEVSWATQILGSNLDEFVATRLGPLFVLAGIGLSLYHLIEGEGGVAMAADILNIVGGSLMLFATVGGWLVSAGVVAAEGVLAVMMSAAGPLAILLAIVGVGLMLYQMFHKPPDPVHTFVDGAASKAGFALAARASAVDYIVPYADPDQGQLLMLGFRMSVEGGGVASVSPTGAVSLLANGTSLPDCVWQIATDGLGLSTLFTVYQPDPTQRPITGVLSAMSDGSVSFQPLAGGSTPASPPAGPTVVSQRWLSTPLNHATLTSQQRLATLQVSWKAVRRDVHGVYAPDNIGGVLVAQGSTLALAPADQPTLPFTLEMSGIAPNFMAMSDVGFIQDTTPSSAQRYAPRFGTPPSTPLTFASTGALPAFVGFDAQAGVYTPNGGVASETSTASITVQATNALGSAQASFTLAVAAAPQGTTAGPAPAPSPMAA